MKKYAAYYRVSTTQQGNSGLGLEAQKATVRNFTGCKDGSCIEQEFTEIESGKKSNRPILNEALAYCKHNKCTLVIAKLDRLSRDVEFIFALKNSKVDFVCCDMPETNTLTVGIQAIFAQNEREVISTRTKAALAAKKARGFKLGNPANLTKDAQQKAVETIKHKAKTDKEVIQVLPIIQNLRKEEKTYREIAKFLNNLQFKTRTGKNFSATQVMRIEKRFI